jgi:hypothetical protein
VTAEESPARRRKEDALIRAAARVLTRYQDRDWQPTGEQLDAWGRGYGAGIRDGQAQDNANRISKPLDGEWPEVAGGDA